MNKLCSFLAGLLALMGCGREKAYHAQLKVLPDFGVEYITTDSLAMLMEQQEELLLLDVRTEKEWSVSRLPHALVVDVEQFNVQQLDTVSRDKPVVVYCSVGYRSGELGKKLKEAGFVQVHNLYGGILEWKNEGRPILTPEGHPTEKLHTYSRYWSNFLEKGEAVY